MSNRHLLLLQELIEDIEYEGFTITSRSGPFPGHGTYIIKKGNNVIEVAYRYDESKEIVINILKDAWRKLKNAKIN